MTKLEASSKQKRREIEYKIDRSNGGNLMPLLTFKNLFPRATMEQ